MQKQQFCAEEESPPAKKILVADDEPAVVNLVKMLLEKKGFQVIGVQNPKDVFATAQKMLPKMLIIDASMNPNGYVIMQMIRGEPTTQHIPIIIMWARSPDPINDNQWQSGADFYLRKPINPIELFNIVDSFS